MPDFAGQGNRQLRIGIPEGASAHCYRFKKRDQAGLRAFLKAKMRISRGNRMGKVIGHKNAQNSQKLVKQGEVM
jgi:hypothetical protein